MTAPNAVTGTASGADSGPAARSASRTASGRASGTASSRTSGRSSGTGPAGAPGSDPAAGPAPADGASPAPTTAPASAAAAQTALGPLADPRILIIIPAWNEAASIGDVIAEIRDTLPACDILVVNDGSTDDTERVALAAGAQVTTLPYNLGVGGAMRLGYRYAHENDYDIAIQIDADGQHDPRYVPKLVDGLGEAAIVIGARFAGEGDYQVRGPRRWAMSLLSFVLSKLARTKLTDTTSGFRACNREIIGLFANWYPVEYLGDTVETLVRAVRLGHRVTQVPVAMRPRAAGIPSNSPVKAMIYLGRAMITLLLALNRR